jgi:NIMA-interacting peptidyl-prolyl cis-trans isomerase 1
MAAKCYGFRILPNGVADLESMLAVQQTSEANGEMSDSLLNSEDKKTTLALMRNLVFIPFKSGHYIIGRDPLKAHINVDHVSVSREHALLKVKVKSAHSCSVSLQALSETNPVFLNRKKIVSTDPPTDLHPGDRLKFAQCPDVYEFANSLPSHLASVRRLSKSGPELLAEVPASAPVMATTESGSRRSSVLVSSQPPPPSAPTPTSHLGKRSRSSSNPAIDSIPAAGGDKVRASHILVKHVGSRRPSSWREAKIVRSREDAIGKMNNMRNKIMSVLAASPQADIFEKIASQQSDCSSAKKAGDLGFFTREKMMKPFSDAAFALKVGEISDIVETDSGIHIIKRTG